MECSNTNCINESRNQVIVTATTPSYNSLNTGSSDPNNFNPPFSVTIKKCFTAPDFCDAITKKYRHMLQ